MQAAVAAAGQPYCVAGCPHKRLFDDRQCLAFKDDPEAYVLALRARIGEG